MSKLEEFINTLGAEDLLTITQRINELIAQHEEAKGNAWRIRTPNTEYKVDDKVIILGVSNFDKVLRCSKAGVSGSGEFPKDYNTLLIGDIINDGSLTWKVVKNVPENLTSDIANLQSQIAEIKSDIDEAVAELEGI
jgi:hypothetical protein